MPAVNLPNGQSAIIRSRDVITERVGRRISRAYMKAAASAAALAKLGFDENDSSTWGAIAQLTDEEQDGLDAFKAELIVGFVESWSLGDLPTTETVLDLQRPVFEALADACAEEFSRSLDTEPNLDPKADTDGLVG